MDLLVVFTLNCILDFTVPPLIIRLFSFVLTRNKCDVELRKELSNLKEDMAGISMVDEFAKYARLQRRCNHLESILKENMNHRLIWRLKLQTFLLYSIRVLNITFLLWLLYTYMNEPVIILSEDVLWPLQDFLSWPCEDKNAISLLTWFVITIFGISACKQLMGDLMTFYVKD